MVLSAVITPSGDPFSMMLVAVPLYILYEMSILVVKE
jgi:sec-independent protein translocase protein TatC